jgi:flagella basal body P-ring formation protein FlgA
MRRLIAILLGSAVCATTGLGQAEIVLRASAIVAGGPVTLRDVAELRGREALALADVVVAPDAGALIERDGWRRLELEAVRSALEAHEAPWGALTLRGGVCAVRIGAVGASGELVPSESRLGGVRGAPGEFGPETVGGMVTAQLARFLGVAPGDIRVDFDAADRASLSRPGEGLVVDARPTGLGERSPVALRVYRGDWIETETALRAQIEVRRRVATTRRDLRRGEVIGAEDVSMGEAWLKPDVAPASAPIGAVARAAIAAGQIVMTTDTEAPMVVRRRDRASVDIVSGTITVQVKMRALQDGRVGDVIQFESMEPDRRDRRQVEARVNGAGRAVAVVGSKGEMAHGN